MINGVTMALNVDDILRAALKEDITSEDVSTNAVVTGPSQGSAQLIAKQDGVLAGLKVFERVFWLLDPSVKFETEYQDGQAVKCGTLIGTVFGDMRVLLSGERTALNYLQRMSGIATMTRRYAEILRGSKTKLLDTRKTTPNMRVFEKYAVKVGGGVNHRYNLSDGILLKDNHIGAAGGIAQAIARARAYAPFVRKIEVETETLEMVQQALDAGADIIMLDNMDDETSDTHDRRPRRNGMFRQRDGGAAEKNCRAWRGLCILRCTDAFCWDIGSFSEKFETDTRLRKEGRYGRQNEKKTDFTIA